MRLSLVLSVVVLLVPSPPLFAQQDAALAIFIRPTTLTGSKRQRVEQRAQRELDRLLRAARDSVSALDKALRQQHGKDRDAWPVDAETRMRAAERASRQAHADARYAEVNPEDLRRVQKWLSEAIAKSAGMLREASAEADADLVIDVRGVWSTKSVESYIKPNVCHAFLAIQPGGRPGSAERLSQLPDSWAPSPAARQPGAARLTASGSPPTVLLEAANRLGSNIVGCWDGATEGAMRALKELQTALRSVTLPAPARPS